MGFKNCKRYKRKEIKIEKAEKHKYTYTSHILIFSKCVCSLSLQFKDLYLFPLKCRNKCTLDKNFLIFFSVSYEAFFPSCLGYMLEF